MRILLKYLLFFSYSDHPWIIGQIPLETKKKSVGTRCGTYLKQWTQEVSLVYFWSEFSLGNLATFFDSAACSNQSEAHLIVCSFLENWWVMSLMKRDQFCVCISKWVTFRSIVVARISCVHHFKFIPLIWMENCKIVPSSSMTLITSFQERNRLSTALHFN